MIEFCMFIMVVRNSDTQENLKHPKTRDCVHSLWSLPRGCPPSEVTHELILCKPLQAKSKGSFFWKVAPTLSL